MTDTEKVIPGTDGLYMATDAGEIISTRSNQRIKPYQDKHGYYRVDLGGNGHHGRQWQVHRIIYKTFVHNWMPDIFPEINHINGNNEDNALINLEECTRGYNAGYAVFMRRYRAGNFDEIEIPGAQVKMIPGAEGVLYASADGRVYDAAWMELETMDTNTKMGIFFKYHDAWYPLDYVIAMAFCYHGDKDKIAIVHKNGILTDCRACNLEFMTTDARLGYYTCAERIRKGEIAP